MRWKVSPGETQWFAANLALPVPRGAHSAASAERRLAWEVSAVATMADRSRRMSLSPGGPQDTLQQRARHRRRWSPCVTRRAPVPGCASREVVSLKQGGHPRSPAGAARVAAAAREHVPHDQAPGEDPGPVPSWLKSLWDHKWLSRICTEWLFRQGQSAGSIPCEVGGGNEAARAAPLHLCTGGTR